VGSLANIKMWIAVATLSVAGLAAAPLHASIVNDQLTAATKMYYQGQVDAAVQALKPIADSAAASAPSVQGKIALEYLLDTCVAAWDYRCLNEYSAEYSQLVASLTDVPDSLKLPFALQPSYYSGVAVWLSGNRSWAEAWIKAWPETTPEVPWVPRDYIRRQLVRAKLYLILEQPDAARLCVDRALASIASVTNAEASLLEMSVWLFDAIGDLLELGDKERAIGLSLTNGKVGQGVFPVNSLEYFRLLRMAAATYEAAGMIPQARDAIERALVVLSHIRLNPDVQAFVASDAVTMAALICVFGDDMACARKHLEEHPLHAALAGIRTRGVLQTLPEVSYLAARALVNAGPAGQAASEDLSLLAKPIELKFPLPMDLLDRVKMYQRVGYAIALMHGDPARSGAELRALAPELLRLETKTTDAIGFLPKRGLIDQLVLSLAAGAFRGQELDLESGDIVVRLLDVLARNGQSYSSEALSLVAMARTDDIRTDVRDLLRLRSRREAAERIDIARMLSAKPTADPGGKVLQPSIDFKRRNIYTDYGTLIRQISARLKVDQPDLAAADAPPSLVQVQESLRENEVVLSSPVLLGPILGHFCIRKNMVRFSTSTEDVPSLVRDIRLLEASLSSQNEPSPELDRQFPITAARHVYDALLLPAKGCMRRGDSIVWVGLAAGDVPLAALLTRGTFAELQNTRLADWPWLAKENAVSQVATASTLVALRRQSGAEVADRKPEFLGIGDPKFSGARNTGRDAAEFAMRGAVGAGTLAALPQLPDTRLEISGTAGLFAGGQQQLLGEEATEGALRRLPLERFTYIEFATHGLVRQDISGLTEAALALTPTTPTDSFNDGLLTASEIADLPLKARFVALSACNTGLLDFTKFASEVPGLSAAFQVAGVPATLGTLWPVESDASRRIVQETFRNLIFDRDGPAVALAKSQRKYLANPPSVAHEHPRFWAPFVVFGDGTTPSENRVASKSAQIGDLRLLTTSGGEVSSIIKENSGGLLLRAMGNVLAPFRHSGMTMRLREDLGEEWVKEDPLVANSQIALSVDGGSILGGYRGGGVIPTVTTIQFMDHNGNAVQEWELARPKLDTSPFRGLRIGPKAALIAIVQHAREGTPNLQWPADRLIIAEVRVGHPLRIRTEFELTTSSNPDFVGLERLGEDVLVVVSRAMSDTLPKSHVDDFHQLSSCGLESHASLTLLTGDKFSKIWEKQLADIHIAKTFDAPDGSVRLVGSIRLGCGEGTRIGLWEISKDGTFRNLFTDQNPRDTQARGGLQRPDGSLLLLGRVNRTTDVDSFAERDTQRMIFKGASNWVSFSTRRIDDAVMIWLDPSLHERSRETLRAGSDIWVTGAVFVGSDIWLYGALGNQAAIMQVTH
jgi:CHAT domain-containing protein